MEETRSRSAADEGADAAAPPPQSQPQPEQPEPEQPEPEQQQPPQPQRRRRPLWQEVPLLIGIAVVLALGIKTFFVQAFSIPSESMQNTLQVGDRVLVDKLTPWFGSKPERGEVVVFHDPGDWLSEQPEQSNAFARNAQKVLSTIGLMPSADEADLIKRVIAVGGDTVTCEAGSPLKVNGVPLHETYLFPGATPCDNDPVGTFTVPKDRIWVMGDHRNDSQDSRYHQIQNPGDGFVPVDDVIGRAFVVAWPIGHWATLPKPAAFTEQPPTAAGRPTAVGDAAPGLAALAGAVPLTLWQRRRRQRG
ncbi:signal peptidase I [Peterkaempfera bronchialis]|uniref:Signal peptidase I n=1 Tax=Peterkaempfera bronchialis TaxID=2126346 RepID=A0A345SVD9_9ACTN|nr:signal peptidase I [Peterkaempfera bronchialis]AXI77694.1 signal peptidase I [Peterkaempfera bronchialis]